MESIILSALLAIGLYHIDYLPISDYSWLFIYVLAIIVHIIWVRKIDMVFNIKKSPLSRLNNFLLHLSLTVALLILVFWLNWASLWEWRILTYSFIQYLVFIIFLIPVFLWIQIYFTLNCFKDSKKKSYLVSFISYSQLISIFYQLVLPDLKMIKRILV